MHNPYVGLLGRTITEIVTYLFKTYGRLLPHQAVANRNKLNESYNVATEPFQLLIDRFQAIQEMAQDAHTPITDRDLITAGLAHLSKGNIIPHAIREWNRKPEEDGTTFLQFKDHFQPKIFDYQSENTTNQENVPPSQVGVVSYALV